MELDAVQLYLGVSDMPLVAPEPGSLLPTAVVYAALFFVVCTELRPKGDGRDETTAG